MNRLYINLILFIMISGNVFADNEFFGDSKDTVFSFLLWPDRGGLIDASTSYQTMSLQLKDRWHKALLPTYTGMTVEIHKSNSRSLKDFVHVVQNNKPEAIEGCAWFVEHEINQIKDGYIRDRLYFPVLAVRSKKLDDLHAMILFRSNSVRWKGTLGVVHPSYTLGGRLQLENWENKLNGPIDWVALNSTDEVLRQFFIGSIDAAAVPEGTLSDFLVNHGREDLRKHLESVMIEPSFNFTSIYLRKDIYNQAFIRTMVVENWLRNHFEQGVKFVPLTWPLLSEETLRRFYLQ